jgi:signal transduction histidine kinase
MKLRGNLFLKIFIAFWLATVAILASWLLSARYFDNQLTALPEEGQQRGHRHMMLQLHYELQNVPTEKLGSYIEQISQRHRVRIWLLDPQGNELLGRPTNPDVLAAAEKLRGIGRRAITDTPRGRLLAHDIYHRDLGHFRAVISMANRQPPFLRTLGDNRWLQLTLAVGISGIICYLLSRLMTKRLQALRRASRQLADGNLEARIEIAGTGGDETDDLARDFNSMADQLQGRIQSQKRLLTDVSHELRSPLARLRVALALAADDPDNQQKHLQRIEREALCLEQLISQLLTANSEQLKLGEQIDLCTLLTEVCENANFEAHGENKSVLLDSSLNHAVVSSQSDTLTRCFDNIIRNAVCHTPEGSTVRVTLNRDHDTYEVNVQDAGPGVPQGEEDAIFESFYRVEQARTPGDGGFGLGLAIAKRAVELHGGAISATNADPGLLISVSLPTATA